MNLCDSSGDSKVWMKEEYFYALIGHFFMDSLSLTRLIIGLAFSLFAVVFFLNNVFLKNKQISVKFISRTAVFAAISIILYTVPYLKFPVFFFPSFLEIHFDEVPAFIAGFAYGPLSAFIIIAIKTIIKLPLTTSLCVGEIADFIYSIAFVIPASILYKKSRNFKGAVIGLGLGLVFQIVVSSLFTSFVMLDFYMNVMGLSKEAILKMCQVANPAVNDLGWTFLLLVALPFNCFKDALVILLTFLLYKKLHKLIDRIKA